MSARPAPNDPSAANGTFSFAAFLAVAERLEAVLDHETESLRRNRPCDLIDTCGRKRQSLLELSRFMPRLTSVAEREGARGRLGRLEAKLETNRQVLDVRIGAVRQVADIISRTLRDAESDGTYSMAAGRA
ncbi:hypothetical protein P7D22_04080 [Lichenihabitans sp. Uapishka_5]|uniref:hypothetical protein n=1 Tax=Lichenihabitans sp. Uapishka_5 TaxID=3037302 RepID=UPI0029E7D178|nr:hypothetical protein [Lichenihabitans sp. Uapishka_5]MDX7950355.1 hypothetical protein [Lichenihabitans sp. Uapishka_5]